MIWIPGDSYEKIYNVHIVPGIRKSKFDFQHKTDNIVIYLILKNIFMSKEPVAFFAYINSTDGKKLSSCSIIVSAPEIEDQRTHSTTWDTTKQKKVDFEGWCYVTSDDEIIDFLDNYNTNNPRALMEVTRKILDSKWTEPVTKIVTQTVVPISIIKDMDVLVVKKMLKETFNHVTDKDSMKDIVAEGKEKWFFI